MATGQAPSHGEERAHSQTTSYRTAISSNRRCDLPRITMSGRAWRMWTAPRNCCSAKIPFRAGSEKSPQAGCRHIPLAMIATFIFYHIGKPRLGRRPPATVPARDWSLYTGAIRLESLYFCDLDHSEVKCDRRLMF